MNAWTFAVEAWDQEATRGAALELQDRHQQCISLLLWRLWAATEARPVAPPLLERAVALARSLETEVLGPCRRARAFLGATPPSPFAAPARDSAREAISGAEAAVERMLIDALEALVPAPDGKPVDPLCGLSETVSAWGGTGPPELLAKLAGAC